MGWTARRRVSTYMCICIYAPATLRVDMLARARACVCKHAVHRGAGAGCVPTPQVAVLQTVLSRAHTCVQVLCRSPTLQLRVHLCTLLQRRVQVLSSVLAGESTCTVHGMIYTVQ